MTDRGRLLAAGPERQGTAITLVLTLMLGGVLLVFPDPVAQAIAAATGLLVSVLGVGVLWLCSAALVLALALVVTPLGNRCLPYPGDPARSGPEFNLMPWLAMLFAAGMGSGLVFWGLAEPLSHFASPPQPEGNADQRATNALALTFLHWGLHAWAVYAIAGLAFACLLTTNDQKPAPEETRRASDARGPGAGLMQALSGSEGLSSGQRWWSGALDRIALLAVLFGVAGSLANGVDLIQVGLFSQGVSGVPGWGILLLLGLAAMASAASGLRRGIALLSQINLWLALMLMVWLWCVTDPLAAASLTLKGLWLYLQQLPAWSLRLVGHGSDAGWAQGWTVVYLLWWIAWTPFVGLFLAGISRGRTIRSYLVGVILVPVVVSVLWFGAFGGGGLVMELSAPGALSDHLSDHYTAPLFAWYRQLPGGTVLTWGSLLLLLVFLVTSADSATWVMRRLGGSPSGNDSGGISWVWGVLMVLLAAMLVLRGDVDVNKQVAIAGAVPFAVVMLLQMVGLLRFLSLQRAAPSVSGKNSVD